MYRYIIIIGMPQAVESIGATNNLYEILQDKASGWTIAHRDRFSLAIQWGSQAGIAAACPIGNSGGTILGCLFRKSTPASHSVSKLSSKESHEIISTGGQALIDQFWGSYVALIHDEHTATHHVLREPLNNIACYHARFQEAHIFFSHIEDCVGLLSIRFSPNRSYLIRWMFFSGHRQQQSGMDDVEDVVGGERISISEGATTRKILWNPVEIARRPLAGAPEDMVGALRRTLQDTISSWASGFQHIGLHLSGGLDSSIVAGCLTQAPTHPRLDFLHEVIDAFDNDRASAVKEGGSMKLKSLTGTGNERHFANLVAAKWRVPLMESHKRLSIDLNRLWEAPLTIRPRSYLAAMELDDRQIELATTHGTQAFFSGQTGDVVLFASEQPVAAIDHAFLHGITPALWQHLLATAKLSKKSIWSCGIQTLKFGLLRRTWHPPSGRMQAPTLLRDDILTELSEKEFADKWDQIAAGLTGNQRLPPGKLHHISRLFSSTYHDCAYHSDRYAHHIHPLNSQPIWDLLLRVPTYHLLADGMSRGLARRAFSDLLPAEIRNRQSKGAGNMYYQKLARKNLPFLRDHLLDGLMVREGYLDPGKLRRQLTEGIHIDATSIDATLRCIAAEVWLQQWQQVNCLTRQYKPSSATTIHASITHSS